MQWNSRRIIPNVKGWCHQGVACHQTWKTQQWPQDWTRSILLPITKKDSTKECFNHQTIALISYASKIVFKILHARLQYYVNQELPDILPGLGKGRGTRDQTANIHWFIEESREFQKNIDLCFINTIKPLTLWIIPNCGNLLKIWECHNPQHLSCLLRNLYAVQAAAVRTLYGTTDWSKIE